MILFFLVYTVPKREKMSSAIVESFKELSAADQKKAYKAISEIMEGKPKRVRKAKAEGEEAYQHRLEIYEAQGNKEIVNENGERRILGYSDLNKLFIPSFADPLIKELKKQYRAGSLREHGWAPSILPLQIAVVGQLAFIGFPGEITTVAFRRLRKQLLDVLSQRGVTNIIVATYANCYFGYCSTREEYDLQLYEGGHTPFGKWTLAGFQTQYQKLAEAMLKPAAERQLDKETLPPVFSEKELSLRTYN